MKIPNATQHFAAILLAVTALLVPWLVFISDRSTAWVIAPVAIAALIAGISAHRARSSAAPNLPIILSLGGLAGITLLAAGSPLWGPEVMQAGMQKQAWRMLPAMAAGIALIWGVSTMPGFGDRSRALFRIGCGIAVLIAVADTLSGRWLLRIRHAVGEGGVGGDLLQRAEAYDLAEFLARFNDFWVVATLCLALLLTSTGKRWTTLFGLVVLAGASLFTISETSLVMTIGGLGAAILTLALGRYGIRFVAASVIAAVLTTPWLFPFLDRLAASLISGTGTITGKIRERLEIWAALSETIPESLLLGHGIAFQRLHLTYPGPNQFFHMDKLWHPHSMFVQIWQDLGLAGASMLCVTIAGLFLAIERAPYVYRPGLAALAVMVLAALGAAHSIWLGWWMCSFFLVAALAIRFVRQDAARA
jgi:hypothetical protein